MTDHEKAQFITEVWSAFEEASGQERLMSPMEWAIAWHWRETGVPLRIVLRGIADVKKPGRSLLYYDKPVEAAMQYWERAMAS